MAVEEKVKLTKETAKKFDSFSESNYKALKDSLDCGCEPYVNVFTFNRWKAQGFKVIKGEKAKRITTFVSSEKENNQGNMEKKSFPKTTCVFCRCQVEEIKIKKA